MVPGRALGPGLALPRLLRLVRREAAGEARRHRLPRQGGAPTGRTTEKAGQYYLHRFYSHQPDLNIANPEVRDEIAQVVGFWLEQGLSGFRVDAVPFMLEPMGMPGGALVDPHELLRDLRRFIGRRSGEAILLGEVNLPPDDQRTFFGDEDGDELHMLFSFTVNQALYLALARESAAPLEQALAELPAIPSDCQWASFVRNHDELTLDKLSAAEREEVFAAFGPEKDLQLFGRGLRRRLPTMLDGDQQRMRMVYSLMFSLPGTPVLFYGEEIGMGENLAIEGRMSVRAPMQWSDEPNGGFSTVEDAKALCRPVTEGAFGPERVNAFDAAPRPRLAAQLVGAPDPAPPRVPRAGLGRVHRAVTARARGPRPPLRLGRLDGRGRAQPGRPRRHDAAAARGRRARSSTCSARRTWRRRTSSSSSRTATAGTASR